MIDFHAHILPGIDDGSDSVQESIKMLHMEAEQGITDVILTPHFYAFQNNINQFVASRNDSFDQLKEAMEPGLPKVYLGAEVQYFEGISVTDEILDLRIEGTNLLLLEMPFSEWSDRVIQDVLSLNERPDIQIVLAHIDRYFSFQDDAVWPYLSNHHVLMQANTICFKSFWKRRKATKLIEQGIINVLGTDCHNTRSRSPEWRYVPKSVIQSISRDFILFHPSIAVP